MELGTQSGIKQFNGKNLQNQVPYLDIFIYGVYDNVTMPRMSTILQIQLPLGMSFFRSGYYGNPYKYISTAHTTISEKN